MMCFPPLSFNEDAAAAATIVVVAALLNKSLTIYDTKRTRSILLDDGRDSTYCWMMMSELWPW